MKKSIEDYQSGNILVVHPNECMRKALILALKNDCKNVLEERGWQDLPIRELTSVEEVVSFKEKENIKLLIAHLERVSSESKDIDNIRQLRMEGMCAPLIALSFSGRNAHRIFSAEKAHALFVYPFHIDTFRKTFLTIKSLTSGDMDCVKEKLCDESYRRTLYISILHAVAKKDWKGVGDNLDKLEQCFGNNNRNNNLRKLLADKEDNTSSWENLFIGR